MRIAFLGSPDFAVPTLQAVAAAHQVVLVVSQPDKPAGRGGKVQSPAVKLAAEAANLPIIQPKSAKTGELRDALAASGAELAVVVAYGKILPGDVLRSVPGGFLNVHASLLPKYRGAAPVQWALIRGEHDTGVSIMRLDEGMDTGPVLLEKRVAIGAEDTAGEVLARLAPIGAASLVEAIATNPPAVAQDHAVATYAPMLIKADGAIDFAGPAVQVGARIRGVDPWPGAYTMLRGEILKLFRAVNAPGQGTAGTVLAIEAAGVLVACGQDAVFIREVQAPGRKRMTAAQLANGRGLAVGDVLETPP
jgi:methionyl-tRNA formyltransferase